VKHYKHPEGLFKCCSSLELRHKKSLYQSVLFVHLKDRYFAYRIASTTYFLKNIEAHVEMDMCMCAAWVGGLRSALASAKVWLRH